MSHIDDVRVATCEFLKKALGAGDIKVVKASMDGIGWTTVAEAYEESSFIKSLNLPTRVQDKNYYVVKLNENLEILSYERQQEWPQKERE